MAGPEDRAADSRQIGFVSQNSRVALDCALREPCTICTKLNKVATAPQATRRASIFPRPGREQPANWLCFAELARGSGALVHFGKLCTVCTKLNKVATAPQSDPSGVDLPKTGPRTAGQLALFRNAIASRGSGIADSRAALERLCTSGTVHNLHKVEQGCPRPRKRPARRRSSQDRAANNRHIGFVSQHSRLAPAGRQ